MRRQNSYDRFIDISLKSGSISLHTKHEENKCAICNWVEDSSALKTQDYVNNLPEIIDQECDETSLKVEEEFKNLETKTFSRNYFHGSNIVSRNRIAKVAEELSVFDSIIIMLIFFL